MLGPYLLVVLCGALRLVGIGDLLPHVDESAWILSNVDSEFRRSIDPLGLGRPLLGFLFFPAVKLHETLLPSLTLLEVTRAYVATAVTLAALILTAAARRWSGIPGAWSMAIFWSAAPFIFLHSRLALQDPFNALFLSLVCAYIFFRPKRRSARKESTQERVLLVVAGVGLLLALLNKISALFELPWLVALYWVEQRRRGESLVSGVFTTRFFALFGAFFGIVAVWMYFTAAHRMALLSLLEPVGDPNKLLQGLFHLQHLLTDYFGLLALILLVVALIVGLLFRMERALFFLTVLATPVMYAAVFGLIFWGRYLSAYMIPLSLVVASCTDALYQGTLSERRGKFARLLFPLWLLGGAVCVASWGKALLATVQNPLENPFSSRTVSVATFRDYEQYTTSWWNGSGIPEVLSFVREERARNPVALLGSADFSPTAMGVKLFLIEEGKSEIALGDLRRWDLPFLVKTLQRLPETKLFLIDVPFCSEPLPAPCDSPHPKPPGPITLHPVKEIPRTDPNTRIRLYEVAPLPPGALREITPPKDRGIYPDGLTAPVVHLAETLTAPTTELVITGEALAGVELLAERIEVRVNGRSLPFTLAQSYSPLDNSQDTQHRSLFTLTLKSPLSPGEVRVDLFFGTWRIELDPFDLTTKYPNLPRAVSVKNIKVLAGNVSPR